MVREPAVAAGDRAGGVGRRDGALPRHAHVHHLRPPEDGHEGRRTPARTRPPPQKGAKKFLEYYTHIFVQIWSRLLFSCVSTIV